MKRPWNITNQTIYSLGVYNNDIPNFNICTYVTAISLKPKLFMIALDRKTLTYEIMQQSSTAVLHILSKDNIKLVRPLGKKTGHTYNKYPYLQKKDLIDQWQGYNVLKNVCGYLLLKKINMTSTAGDHDIFIFNVKKYKTLQESNILTMNDLIVNKIIL